MRKNTILTYDDVRRVRSGNSDETLLAVDYYDNSIAAQYEKFDMVPYVGFEILVRDAVARKLAAVNKKVRDKYGLTLKVVYGYRALEVQTDYFNKQRSELRFLHPRLSEDMLDGLTHNFIAVPDVAGHVTGGAVDLTLIGADGIACDMGTKIADFSDKERIKTFAIGLSSEQERLRKILLDEMIAEGFAPFLGEWWHFSYGDREWVAYYGEASSLYGPIAMEKTVKVMRIAGGNETVLQIIKRGEKKDDEMHIGTALLRSYPTAEQSGLLYIKDRRLQMAGGEFCANASAATAVILANELGESTIRYTVSGFDGDVAAEVMSLSDNVYRVRTSFIGMKYEVERLMYEGVWIDIVDMKGIIHVLIDGAFPASNYESVQRTIVNALKLRSRGAVGVIWYSQQDGKVQINPVVWVRDVDTLYYESACGSGSIAVALCTGLSTILQPTGECIRVSIEDESLTVESEVTSIG